jgi:deoxyribonuclease-2
MDQNSRRNDGILEIVGELNDDANPPALIRTLRNLVAGDGHEGNARARDGANYTGGTKDTPFFMYNDQPDNANPGSNYGHTKGVVGVSETSSFWLLHSTPNFPSSDNLPKFAFPEAEIIYGQTFLCMTLASADVDEVAMQLLYTTPYVYHSTVPDSVIMMRPNLASVFNKDWITQPGTHATEFTLGHTTFTSYAKNGQWNQDIFEDLIAPALESDLVVESWMRGLQLGSYCKPKYKYQVTDVTDMVVKGSSGNQTWTETQDHAKWCLTMDGSSRQCICDINRMSSQRKRGGGCVCFKDVQLNAQLSGSIAAANKC